MIFRFAALLAALWLGLAGAALAAEPTFPALTGRVVDQADLLSPGVERQLTDTLAALERDTTDQLVVVTLPSLQDREIEDYGYQLGRAWGIGQKDKDNGALLIVAPNERKVRIEVGYGLEPVLTDALSALIIQNQILPSFRDGAYERGIVDGVDAIDRQLRLDPEEARARAAAAEAPQSDFPLTPVIVAGLIFFFLFSNVLGALSRGGRRRRGGGLGAALLWMAADSMRDSGGRGGGWGGGGGGFGGGGGSFGGGGASGGW